MPRRRSRFPVEGSWRLGTRARSGWPTTTVSFKFVLFAAMASSCGCLELGYLRVFIVRRFFAGAEPGSHDLQVFLNPFCERVRATEDTSRDPFHVLVRLHGLAEICLLYTSPSPRD